MISSMDLFFRRDCAVGRGPAIDAPRPLGCVAFPAVAVAELLSLDCAVVAAGVSMLAAGFDAPGNAKLTLGADVEVEGRLDEDVPKPLNRLAVSDLAPVVVAPSPPNRFEVGTLVVPVD